MMVLFSYEGGVEIHSILNQTSNHEEVISDQ